MSRTTACIDGGPTRAVLPETFMETGSYKSRVLVVDDDSSVSGAFRHVLSAGGYTVRTAPEGKNALNAFTEWRPQLVITDLRMAPMDGIELCRRIRAESMVPIIVVSGDAGESSKVAALDSGADDYIVRPIGNGELLARVRAALRRTPASETAPLEAGHFRIDFDLHRVYVRGKEVRLTPKEFELLVYFARHPHSVIPHVRILSAVWGAHAADRVQYLRVYARQLRVKVEADPSTPRYLRTEPWVGYWFTPGGSA